MNARSNLKSVPTNTLVQDDVFTLSGSVPLSDGNRLIDPKIACRRIGATGLPVVLVLGGISASRSVWCSPGGSDSGWWQCQIGPGNAVDTDRYQVIAIDYVGGNGESESPRNWALPPVDFPEISTLDQARFIELLLAHLQITYLHSVIGASYGGMVALQLAANAGTHISRSLAICSAHEASPLASAWRHVQREIVQLGLETDRQSKALRLARALAVCTYRTEAEFSSRFNAQASQGRRSVVSYLSHCGDAFADHFDPHAYLRLSGSIDSHCLDPSRARIPVDLLGFQSDQIVPPAQLITLRSLLPGSGSLKIHPSRFGHDAFLKEELIVSSTITNHLEQCK